MSYKPEHEAIYKKYGVPAEPVKPKKGRLGWLKTLLIITVFFVVVAGIFQINPVCGIGLFLLIPIMTNL